MASGKVVKASKDGYLPCFSLHMDHKFDPKDFFANSVFVTKVALFLSEIVKSSNLHEMSSRIGGEIHSVDPKDKSDRALINSLGWTDGKIYRVDYGNTPYRLCFGVRTSDRRCYILALDAFHKTFPVKGR